MVSGGVGDFYESAGCIELVSFLALRKCELDGVVNHIAAVYVFIEIVTL
jgi:hypothetical protein